MNGGDAVGGVWCSDIFCRPIKKKTRLHTWWCTSPQTITQVFHYESKFKCPDMVDLSASTDSMRSRYLKPTRQG